MKRTLIDTLPTGVPRIAANLARGARIYDTLAEALLSATGTELTAIGRITDGDTLRWLENGEERELELRGFTHF